MIVFENVTKKYGDLVVLDNINLTINYGEFVSIVGPSGAGKSTLIRLLICEEKPTSGRIFVTEFDITNLTPFQIPFYRRHIGVVFQDYKLLPEKTVYENVAYALEVAGRPAKEIKNRVPRILELTSLLDKKNNFPHELSGGEMQRVSLARALVHQPKLLIADEPTGNLDPINAWEIIQLLLKINASGTTVLLATHNREIVDSLQKRVITLNKGKIVKDQSKGNYVI